MALFCRIHINWSFNNRGSKTFNVCRLHLVLSVVYSLAFHLLSLNSHQFSQEITTFLSISHFHLLFQWLWFCCVCGFFVISWNNELPIRQSTYIAIQSWRMRSVNYPSHCELVKNVSRLQSCKQLLDEIQ